MREVFDRSLASGDELGASVCVYHRGVPVVDLWGGFRDRARNQPWARDTIVCMMSVTKAMASLSLLTLIERGQIALDAPVARYWPEFAQAGKENITVRHLLGHKTGVLFPDTAPVGSLYQWDVVVDAIARQPAEWTAGAHGAYQSFTHGFMTGELVRRITGLTIGTYFRQEIASPLGADFHIGVPEADLPRVSDLGVNPENGAWAAVHDPSTKLGRAWRAMPRGVESANTVDFRVHEFPSANGHGNAAAVARLFAALANGGALDGIRILSPETVAMIGEEQWDDICRMTDRPFRMGLGMFVAKPGFLPYGDNPKAFGHSGIGGAVGFADPDRALAFSYCTSWMCEGTGPGRRGPALIDAMFASI